MRGNLNLKAALLSCLLLVVLLFVWQAATLPSGPAAAPQATMTPAEIEYQKLLGKGPQQVKASGFPTPLEMGATAWKHLSNPFYDNGPNDKGIAIQLGYSLGRVGLGFLLACIVAIPLGLRSACRRCCTRRSIRSSRC